MLVVMQSHSTPEQIERVLETIRQMGLTPHPMPGATRTAIGITGNTGAVDSRTIEVMPGVLELIRVTKPYKLASREMHDLRHGRHAAPRHIRRPALHDHRRPLLGRERGDRFCGPPTG